MAATLLLIPSKSDEYGRLRAQPVPGLELCDPAPPDYPADQGAYLPPRLALHWAEQAQAARVLIGDLRCAAALRALREAGWHAERIGHRRFGGDRGPGDPDSSPGLTTWEQITAAGRVALTPEEQGREAWQRDGWCGLSALGLGWKTANAFARTALQQSEQQWTKSREGAQRDLGRELDDLILALAPRHDPAHVDLTADALQSPPEPRDGYPPGSSAEDCGPADRDPRDYRQAAHRREPVEVKPVLVLNCAGARRHLKTVTRVEYRCPRSAETWLRSLIEASDLNHAFDLTLEVGSYRCRLIATLPDGPDECRVDLLVSRLLGVALVTGRPLRHYGCTFYLPLDLHLDLELNPPARAPDPQGARTAAPDRPDRWAAALDSKEGLAQSHPICTPGAALNILSETISNADKADQRGKVARGELTEEAAEAQALLYFLPALQRRIFETCDSARDDSIRHWRLPAARLTDLKFQVEQDNGDPRAHCAKIQDVSLYGHRNHLFVLAIRVGMTDGQQAAAERLRGDDMAWWRPLCDAETPFEDIATLQAERWLWFTKAARLLRPAFPQQELEGKISTSTLAGTLCSARFDHTHAFSPIVLTLLEKLTGIAIPESSGRLRRIGDDRMVVNVAYGLAGPASDDAFARAAYERLFSLGLFVDRGTDGFASQGGYAYDQGFVQGQMPDHVNRRWAGLGTLYGYTRYSNCAMGFGDYFCGPLARVHVPYVYGRMLLLALFYELTLTYFDRCIGQATLALAPPGDLIEVQTEAFNRLYQRFIRFTNDQWFRDLTSQTQGAETFRLQTRALGLDAQYALIKDKLERSDAFIEQWRGRRLGQAADDVAREGIRLNERATQLTQAAIVAGLAALWLALVAPVVAVLQIVPETAKRTGLSGVLAKFFDWEAWARTDWHFVLGFVLVAVSTLGLIVAVWWIRRLIKKKPQVAEARKTA